MTLLHAGNGQNYYLYADITTDLNKRAIVEISKREGRRLSMQKKIPKSWKFVSPSNIEKDRKNSSWIVSYNNLKVKHKKNQTLYIRLDEKGNVISSSYKRLTHTKNK